MCDPGRTENFRSSGTDLLTPRSEKPEGPSLGQGIQPSDVPVSCIRPQEAKINKLLRLFSSLKLGNSTGPFCSNFSKPPLVERVRRHWRGANSPLSGFFPCRPHPPPGHSGSPTHSSVFFPWGPWFRSRLLPRLGRPTTLEQDWPVHPLPPPVQPISPESG